MPDSNARYTGTWSEINARIAARDNALLHFVAFAGVLIGFSVKDGNGIYGIGIGYIALAYTLLQSHHDLIIGHLSDYQSVLIDHDTVNSNLPNWHTEERVGKALRNRSVRDIALFCFISLCAGSLLFLAYWDLKVLSSKILWFGSLLCTFVAVFFIAFTNITRNSRAKLRFKNQNNVGQYGSTIHGNPPQPSGPTTNSRKRKH